MVTIPTGLLGSEQALQAALAGAGGIIDPFARGGTDAFNLQAAQSGASGPGAQARAFRDFQASPGQQFLVDESERALTRNAAALGGLGGGNVRRALQKNAIGLASQDFGNQFARLGQVSNLGGQAAGQQAGLVQQTGRDLSSGRTQAGRDIAGEISDTTSNLSQLIQQQGVGLSDIISGSSGNIAQLLAAAGTGNLESQQALATLLANIGVGQGSQLAGLSGIPGVQQQQGSTAGTENIGRLLSAASVLF